MKLLVIGAGATGGWFGGLAVRGGADVTMIARGPNGRALAEHGLRASDPSGAFVVHPRVAPSLAELPAGETWDVILVTTKMGDLPAVLPEASRRVVNGGAVITAQNGVDAEEVAAPSVREDALCGAVLLIGASMPEPGVVKVQGMSAMIVGAHRPAADGAARRAVDFLAASGVPARLTADLVAARWTKLVWNAAWNPLTALTGLTVAKAAADPGVRRLGVAIMNEVASVARACGAHVPPDVVAMCLGQADAVGDVTTSMLQDVRAGRPLEHDALCGAVIRRGEAHGVPTPTLSVIRDLLAAKR